MKGNDINLGNVKCFYVVSNLLEQDKGKNKKESPNAYGST